MAKIRPLIDSNQFAPVKKIRYINISSKNTENGNNIADIIHAEPFNPKKLQKEIRETLNHKIGISHRAKQFKRIFTNKLAKL